MLFLRNLQFGTPPGGALVVQMVVAARPLTLLKLRKPTPPGEEGLIAFPFAHILKPPFLRFHSLGPPGGAPVVQLVVAARPHFCPLLRRDGPHPPPAGAPGGGERRPGRGRGAAQPDPQRPGRVPGAVQAAAGAGARSRWGVVGFAVFVWLLLSAWRFAWLFAWLLRGVLRGCVEVTYWKSVQEEGLRSKQQPELGQGEFGLLSFLFQA